MATGWVQVGSTWYYLDPSNGAMATGWLQISGTWYHFSTSGQLIG
jgi:choline-binding protein F